MLDGILLVILVTGFFFALSAIVGLDGHINRYDAIIDRYSREFFVQRALEHSEKLSLLDTLHINTKIWGTKKNDPSIAKNLNL